MRKSVVNYSLSVVLASLLVLLGTVSAFAQDVYPPPEGPVEVLPTVIEQAPTPASRPAVEAEELPATGAGVTAAAIVALGLVVGGGAVLMATRRPRRDR